MIYDGPAVDPFPFVRALRGLHFFCQHAGESPCSRKAKYPGMCAHGPSFITRYNPNLLPPFVILLLIDLTRLQRAFGINDPTPCGINDPAIKGREYKLDAVGNPLDA